MASATAMASLRIPCVRQNFGGSLNPKPDSARLSMAFVAPSRVGVSYSLPKLGFLRRSELGTRPAPLHAVVPQSEFLAEKSPIGLNGSTLPLRRRRIEPSTVCSASAADGDEIAVPSGLEKPSQSFADKYPVLITGFFLFYVVSIECYFQYFEQEDL